MGVKGRRGGQAEVERDRDRTVGDRDTEREEGRRETVREERRGER